MILTGPAGTGKSRTVRACVAARGKRARLAGGGEDDGHRASLLAAPTGCASFQLKFGATTLHRAFGVPVGYCGPWTVNQKQQERYKKMRQRLQQAELFVLDEMSMVGRGMMGKIAFKVENTLGSEVARSGGDHMAGKDVVLAGDPKQAPPIGDDPLYRNGMYTGKGQNKPRGEDRTPDNAWPTRRLHMVGQTVRELSLIHI